MKVRSFRRRLGASGVSENGMVCQPRDTTCSIKRRTIGPLRILSADLPIHVGPLKRALRTRSRFSRYGHSSRQVVALAEGQMMSKAKQARREG